MRSQSRPKTGYRLPAGLGIAPVESAHPHGEGEVESVLTGLKLERLDRRKSKAQDPRSDQIR